MFHVAQLLRNGRPACGRMVHDGAASISSADVADPDGNTRSRSPCWGHADGYLTWEV